ncbi:hypothetical protein [Helicobacter turcicus]|uniref:Uncharacterized protein n=1 Tax=Helicobacter turcicus TaxID=2867412 RepID=A0ABS7JQA7_9HELI|nr:hypothetical protein [Helicobacter turcicus]MBX7491543.1 hypothetical protein [Helicobacter turcicus]MBX7546395.1 hypothetical protein [Helicobacter turcicus]
MRVNNQTNVYANYEGSNVLLNRNTNLEAKHNKEQKVEISDEELLKQVREYYNYPTLNNERMIFLVSEPSTYVWKQEIATKSANIEIPTKNEYEQSLRFLEQQMDKIMAEVARENYDLIQLAKQIEKVEFAPKTAREYTQEEKDLMGDGGTEGYSKLLYIMDAYSVREIRENPPTKTYTEKEAKDMALNHSLPEEDYSVFFSHIADKLSPQQRGEIIEAIAKVQSYEEENGAQIYNVLLKKNQETGQWEYSSLINKSLNAESLIIRYSHLTFQSVLDILENKEKLESNSTSDSIMQTLLRESKDNKKI